eukprot:m.86847 g.86847  ORF g.86847 m.86847 type:complete len:83 (-) comp8773_c0_seq3:187-435(-)
MIMSFVWMLGNKDGSWTLKKISPPPRKPCKIPCRSSISENLQCVMAMQMPIGFQILNQANNVLANNSNECMYKCHFDLNPHD